MPFITVKLAKGRTIEQKQQFVESITNEAVKTLNVKKECKSEIKISAPSRYA